MHMNYIVDLLTALLAGGGVTVILVKETIRRLDNHWRTRINESRTMVYIIELERVVIYLSARLLVSIEQWGIGSVPRNELLRLHCKLEDRYLMDDQRLKLFSVLRTHASKLAEHDPFPSLKSLEVINILLELHDYSHRVLGADHESAGSLDALQTSEYIGLAEEPRSLAPQWIPAIVSC